MENQNIENVENVVNEKPVKAKFDKKSYNDVYNKQYYEKNKEKLLAKALTKVECEKCKRIMNYNRLNKHIASTICINTYNRLKYLNEK